ncbi:MAG: SDR family oxidoreductase, partial [Dehalococcoidales bacterium]|nr:SDR family oxidoreductase [Dehalococcoidales bacterium]
VRTPLTEKMLADEAFEKYVTANIPLGRLADPEDIAYAALFLASDMANMITGHVLSVDGGWTIK